MSHFSSSVRSRRVIAGLSSICALAVAAPVSAQPGSVCAQVRIEIEQEAVMTRSAFSASLRIENPSESLEGVENLWANLTFYEFTDTGPVMLSAGALESKFFIAGPEVVATGAGTEHFELNATQTLPPGGALSVTWTIIPTREAAPDGPAQYAISGTVGYMVPSGDSPGTLATRE